MSLPALWSLTALAMLAFAANSLFCRMALVGGHIDPASFVVVRLVSGALALALIFYLRSRARRERVSDGNSGSWSAAIALFVYAAGFAFAYVALDTGTGALILFAAVQLGMLGAGLWSGERFGVDQWCGLAIALVGVVVLLAPSATRPEPGAALMMTVAGLAWAYYSLAGRSSRSALAFTRGNFIRSGALCVPLLIVCWSQLNADLTGVLLALASGALASGVGYALWYAVLPSLAALTASGVQLSVPVLAALMGVLVLAEPITLSLLIASVAVLSGIALVIRGRGASRQPG